MLDEERIANSLPSFGFFVLLITSTIIATFGLIANNTAVVIGALIVAGPRDSTASTIFGLLAVIFATVNVVGGFMVTHRMLQMFHSERSGSR